MKWNWRLVGVRRLDTTWYADNNYRMVSLGPLPRWRACFLVWLLNWWRVEA